MKIINYLFFTQLLTHVLFCSYERSTSVCKLPEYSELYRENPEITTFIQATQRERSKFKLLIKLPKVATVKLHYKHTSGTDR